MMPEIYNDAQEMSKIGKIEPVKNFYKKQAEMSNRGRGRKKERDLVTAPVIRPPPGKVTSKGNLPKSKKGTPVAKPKKSQTRSKVDMPNFSSDESESNDHEDVVESEHSCCIMVKKLECFICLTALKQ